MNGLKKVFNVFGIILAVVFSVPLIASLIAAPVLSGVNEFTKIENLKKIVDEIDFETLAGEAMGASGLADAELQLFLEEGILGEILDLYVEDVLAALDSTSATKKLTGDAVMVILENHMDAFVAYAKSQLDEETLAVVTDEMIAQMLREDLGEVAQSMADSMPSIDQLGIPAEVIEVMELFRAGTVTLASTVLVAVLAFVVFLCQAPRFKSFMWLGIDFLIGGGLAFVVSTMMSVFLQIMTAYVPVDGSVLNPVVGVFAAPIKKGALIELGLAVLFIVIFIVGRLILKKKAAPQVA